MKIESNSAIINNSTGANRVIDDSKEIADENKKVEDSHDNRQNFPGERQIIDAIEKSNKDFKMPNTSLKFSIHEKTKQILVKIVDNETREVIKEIPPEKILDMVASMLERTGLFLDKKA